MLTVEEALATILGQVKRLPFEQVALLDALGRTLAEDVLADIPVPPFDNSAVDGYAVRASDVARASAETPVTLRLLGEAHAGNPATETVVPGTAIKIMTGAPMPAGADAAVMVEDTRLLEGDHVAIREAVAPGRHVRYAGEDMARGAPALAAGTLIRAAEIGTLATLARTTVPVVRVARVAVLATGDELVEPIKGEIPPYGKIRDSNRYMLAALVREAGAIVHTMTFVPDDPAATEAALRACMDTEVDVIVTAGGVSVGERDFVRPALEKLGTLALWRVAMKPGKPLAFGSIGRTLFFGLPGNPVSALVTFELFVRPTLWKLAGRADALLARRRVMATTTEPISHVPGRREYVRAITTQEGDRFVAQPTGRQESHRLRSLLRANSLIVVPEESEDLPAGAPVAILLLD